MSIDALPRLSVVIPTHNRCALLRRCLRALERQAAPPGIFEVVVVDDGSVDETVDMLETLETSLALSWVVQENSGVSAARNEGARKARGDNLLFLDDDIVASPALVSAHLSALESHPGCVVLGLLSLEIAGDENPFVKHYQARWEAHYAALREMKTPPTWMDCYGGNFSLARRDFLAVGGFATDLRRSVDVELGYRLAQFGLAFRFEPAATGVQADAKGMRALLADAEESGAAWIAVVERHPACAPRLLDGYANASPRETWAHRILLRVGCPTSLLSQLGRLALRRDWQRRLYRFLHNHAYWRGMRRAVADGHAWRRMFSGTRILLYHAIAGPGERRGQFVLPVSEFAWQLSWLQRRGYNIISLAELVDELRAHRPPPERSLVVTFDDGYSDNRAALALLAETGTPATLFVVAGRLGRSNNWSESGALKDRRLLSASDLAEIAEQPGLTIGSHGCTHAHLESLSDEDLAREMSRSRCHLRDLLERPVRFFAYPYGEFGTREEQTAEMAGYGAACGIEPGPNGVATPLLALRRDEIVGTISRLRFALRYW